MINTGKTTLKDALNRESLDIKLFGMGDRLERLEKQIGWHGAQDSTNRNTLKSVDTLAQCIAIVNDLKTKMNAHFLLDVLTHKAADSTNAIAAATATNLATAITMANELKADFNAHRVLGTSHDPGSTVGLGNAAADVLGGLDKINIITSADATTLATLQTLVQELQVDYRLHTFRGPIGIDDEATL